MPVMVGFSWDGLWHWVFSWLTTLAVRKNNRDIRCQTRLQPVEIPWGSNGSWSHVGSNRIESPRSVRNLEQPGGCRLCQIMFLCEELKASWFDEKLAFEFSNSLSIWGCLLHWRLRRKLCGGQRRRVGCSERLGTKGVSWTDHCGDLTMLYIYIHTFNK